VAWIAGRIHGCDVELVDINPRRAPIAQALSVRFADPSSATREADVVVHASGTAPGLALALSLAAFEATIIEMSWYGDGDVPVGLGREFHARRLTLRSSQVGHIAATQRARWDGARRMQLVFGMLADPALDVLITGESDFDSLPSVMGRLATAPGDTLCHRIRYPS
jgi:threonine dehydrogenase-like Zn-dependent dehydrogenase